MLLLYTVESGGPAIHTIPFVYNIWWTWPGRVLACTLLHGRSGQQSFSPCSTTWWAGAVACIPLHVRLGRALARALWHGGPGLMEHWQARLDEALAGRAECWRARRSFGMHSVAWRARPDQVVYPVFVLTRLLQVSSDSRRIVPARHSWTLLNQNLTALNVNH
jgi:hypothetical protein